MTSDRQREANKNNASKSTGPRSAKGKAKSRRNALKHGLTAERLLLPDEDPKEFDALRNDLFDRFEPIDALEGRLVARVTDLLWRLQRIPTYGVALLAWSKRRQHRNEMLEDDFREKLEYIEESAKQEDLRDLGQRIAKLLGQDLIGKLDRYEKSIANQLMVTLQKLEDLQNNRLKTIDIIAQRQKNQSEGEPAASEKLAEM